MKAYMGINTLWALLIASLPALKNAWPTVIGLMLFSAMVGYGFAVVLGARANSIKDASLKLAEGRVADYRDRLEGKTPDQAAAKLGELEAEIANLRSELVISPDKRDFGYDTDCDRELRPDGAITYRFPHRLRCRPTIGPKVIGSQLPSILEGTLDHVTFDNEPAGGFYFDSQTLEQREARLSD